MAATIDDVTDMLIFARVVDEQSFTAAARRMGLSKSVVSARVMRLEERLGTRLLLRTTRRLSLTEDGLRFYERCARVAAEADEAAGIADDVGGARGARRGTAPASFPQRPLTAAVPASPEGPRGTRLGLAVPDGTVALVAGGFDVGVRIQARLAASSLVARRLTTDRILLCAAPAYLARRGTPATP